jgi:hypothetical protein
MEFKLRPGSQEDLPSLVHHANNWNVAKNLMDRFLHPYTEADGLHFIEMFSNENPPNVFAIEVGGRRLVALDCICKPTFTAKMPNWVTGWPSLFGAKASSQKPSSRWLITASAILKSTGFLHGLSAPTSPRN